MRRATGESTSSFPTRWAPRWWSLHRKLLADQADPLALWRAQAIDPLSPQVACEELLPPGKG